MMRASDVAGETCRQCCSNLGMWQYAWRHTGDGIRVCKCIRGAGTDYSRISSGPDL